MKYTPDKVKEICDWIKANGLMLDYGSSQKKLCKAVGINPKTWSRWMKKVDFADAVKKAQAEFRTAIVEQCQNNLVRVAKGYEWKETKTEITDDGTGAPKISKQVTTNRNVAPSVAANIFLLTNLDPQHWQNKQNTDVTSGGKPLQVVVSSEKVKNDMDKLKDALK